MMELRSNFGFNFNLRRYIMAGMDGVSFFRTLFSSHLAGRGVTENNDSNADRSTTHPQGGCSYETDVRDSVRGGHGQTVI